MLKLNIEKSQYIKDMMYRKKLSNKIQFYNQSLKRKIIFLLSEINILPSFIRDRLNYEIKKVDKEANYFSDDRIVIYTAVFGDYDEIIEPEFIPDNCDFFIITNNKVPSYSRWNKLEVNLQEFDLSYESNIEKNRFIKMHPHLFFPDYKYSIYIDGNISVITDPTEFIYKLNHFGLALHNHYRRECVYDEIQTCIETGKDSVESLKRHRDFLTSRKMPRNYGMIEAPIIVREHHNPKCINIMEKWWYEFCSYSKRDQIALPHILWEEGIRIAQVASLGNDIYSNYAFRKVNHKSKQRG